VNERWARYPDLVVGVASFDHLVREGWDNAPHHPEVITYPHHTHTAQDVRESSVRGLDDVLAFLKERLLHD
jgi:hypothetical protein